ncbi:siderophore-interacting protein [Roseovarius aestuarii]|nr:siderophore-interacting protein [Roseovarius aestuarii]
MTKQSPITPAALSSRAQVSAPYDMVAEQFCAFAQQIGLQAEDSDEGVSIRFRLGQINLSGTAVQTQVELTSESASSLQLLRDLVAERMTEAGLTPEWSTKAVSSQPANMSMTTVVEVRPLTPSYTRVVIEGPDLARFDEGGFHFRLLFGPEGAGWPYLDNAGITQWPGGSKAWHRPVYTTRSIETQPDGLTRIAFDVFLHDGGRVTEWCRSLTVGTQMAVTGPGGGRGAVPAAWVCLIGDETAVPVIARMLKDLPETTKGAAVLFVPDAGDIQDLPHPRDVQIEWKLRGGDATPLGSLQDAILPNQDRFVFFAAERKEVIAARGYLIDNGLDKGEFQCAAYWTDEDMEKRDER